MTDEPNNAIHRVSAVPGGTIVSCGTVSLYDAATPAYFGGTVSLRGGRALDGDRNEMFAIIEDLRMAEFAIHEQECWLRTFVAKYERQNKRRFLRRRMAVKEVLADLREMQASLEERR